MLFCAHTDINECDLRSLYSLSLKHDLAPLVAYALEGFTISDDEAKSAFSHQLKLSIYRRALLDNDFDTACSLFDKENIDYIPLKGAIIKDLYPQSYLRTSCDNDILIKSADKDKAKALLSENGFVIDNEKEKDISFISGSKMNTELHFSLVEQDSKYAYLLDNVWDNARRKNGNRYDLLPEFFVLYHIAHMATHMHDGGCGIRPFIDLYLYKTKIGYDELAVKSQLDTLSDFYEAVTRLISVWFENKEHTEVTSLLEEFIVSGGSYGTRENMASAKQEKGRGKYILSRIFMPKASLAKIYPQIEKRPYLIPFYQVKRWFKLLNRETRSLAKSELKGSESKTNLFELINL